MQTPAMVRATNEIAFFMRVVSGLTTQAQRRRANELGLQTATRTRRSLQRMVRPNHRDL
jgi:hypothetical protein